MKSLVVVESPYIQLDLRYTTKNNFTHNVVFNRANALLRPEVAEVLQDIAEFLYSQEHYLVIWDSYRTPKEQAKLLAVYDEDQYVSRISNHSRGVAVDVTLANLKNKLLDMGTDFDEFTERAHSEFMNLQPHQIASRHLLRQAMEQFGFQVSQSEWWHFDFSTLLEAPIIEDIDV